jgi:hypothetical protein
MIEKFGQVSPAKLSFRNYVISRMFWKFGQRKSFVKE